MEKETPAQTVVMHPTITLAGARVVVEAAVQEAMDIDVPVCIAVVDASGALLEFMRMDGAATMSIQIAQDKAYTVTSFGLPTSQWYPMIKEDGAMLHGIVKTDRLMIFGGGVPLLHDGELVGAVGVSGGTCDEDVQIATRGAAALG